MIPGEWQARVECGGRLAGAGFLVTADKVLTCAHVVQDGDRAPVTVSFPQRPGAEPVPARVVARGGWPGLRADRGDLAVLQLASEVAIAPAVLAPADAAHGDRRLVAYGFPQGYDDDGTLAEYRTAGPFPVMDEWIQLVAWSGHGQPLVSGFSGAAVALVETGEVVGMVTAADRARDVRTGRMMPTHVIARYWPDLSDLVPFRPPAGLWPNVGRRVEAGAGARLRGLVEKAARAGLDCDPVRLYRDAAGEFDPEPPAEGFASLWAAAWFVLCEVDDPLTPARFADRLDALLTVPVRTDEAPDWSPILVEVRPSGAGHDVFRVEVSAYSGRRRHLVASSTVAEERLPAYVRDHVEEAFPYLRPGADELIAFALPRDRLDLPVDRWGSAPDDPTPLGLTYPVVVTDHARRAGGKRHVLTRVWDRLRSYEDAPVQRVACDCPDNPMKLRRRMRQPDACLAGFAAASPTARTRPHFEESVTAPAPMIVWSRRGCEAAAGEAGCAGDCSGAAFLDVVDARLSHVSPAELPRAVLALREEADAEDDHWARDIQLLWDDPRCFTDEHAGAVHTRSPLA
ncbi:trypsin-like peptidase domain-containing protein [Streptomyces sp. NPDC092369]|uniref:VMAP-C domain-containing protein n=1 Tax=Streptomyces sp. NPDC092369 TaxID=3366015 RepID=UPI003821AD6C